MPGSIKERYEELFGSTPDYDPIKIADDYEGRGKRRALDIEASVPEIDASGGAGGIPYRSMKSVAPEQGVGGNVIDLLKTGTAMLGEAVVGVGEYAARQATPDEGVAHEILTDVSSGLEGIRGYLAEYRQGVYDSMPEEAIAKKGAEFLTLDPNKTIWTGSALDVGEAILYKFMESVPMMAATIIPGAVMMRAGASARAISYLGASEGGLSVGFIANDITDGIQEMDDETLARESVRFAQLLQTMDSPEAARNQLIQEAQGLAPLIGGVLVGAISATAGRYIQPIITGKTATGAATGYGVLQRAGRGAVSEGLIQEGPQESIEQMTQNIAAAVYDGDREVLEGVAEAFIQGAVVGAPGGALVGVIAGDSGAGEPPADTPEGRDQPGAPSSFRDVFGEQVPPPGGYTGAQPEQGDLFGDDPNLLVEAPLDGWEDARELQEGARQTRADRIRAEVLSRKKKGKKKREKARAGRLAGVLDEELVDPALAAAVSASIRGESVMDDMVDNISTQTPEATGQAGNLGGRMQGEMGLTGGGPNSQETGFILVDPQAEPFEDVMGPNEPGPQQPPPAPPPEGGIPVPTGGQGELFDMPQGAAPEAAPAVPVQEGLTQEQRGITPVDGWVVRMTDDSGAVIEEDIFATAEEAEQVADQWHVDIPDAFINVTRSKGARTGTAVAGAPVNQQGVADQPTAEPLADIIAQLEDLADPDSDREAVYLSADNIARLQRDNLAYELPQVGVPIPNFDGKGGMLIARDESVAIGAFEMVDLGMPMETVLGILTRSGAGKPMGDTVVQIRDEAGRVIRETLVANEEEAFAMAEEIGDAAVVLTSAQALKRREQLIADEQGDIELAREGRRQQEIIREQLPMEERGEVERVAGEGRRKTRVRAAAGTLGVGAKKADVEKAKAIGGFFPPDTLEFANDQQEQDYREAFGRLVDNQIEQELGPTYPIHRRAELKKEEKKLFEQIGKIRQLTKPKRKVTRVLKTAAKIDTPTVAAARDDLTITPLETDDAGKDYFVGEQVTRRTREEIDELAPSKETTPELQEAFGEAAYWLAGQFRNVQIVPEYFGVEIAEGLREQLDTRSLTDREISGSDDVLTRGAEVEVDPLLERAELAEGTRAKRTSKKPAREVLDTAEEATTAIQDVLEISTKEELKNVLGQGDPLKFIADQFALPGQKKKLIRRVNNYIARREHGGKSKAIGITAGTRGGAEFKVLSAAEIKKLPAEQRKQYAADLLDSKKVRTTSEFDTGVLTQQTLPQDESVSSKLKRENRSKEAKKDLQVAVNGAVKLIDRLENPDSNYSKLIGERDIQGNLTDKGQSMLVAMHYFIALNDFALSLLQSGQNTTNSSNVIEKLAKQLRKLTKFKPETFARHVAILARADEKASLRAIAYPRIRAVGMNPTKREATIEKSNRELLALVSSRLRLHDRWKNNFKYNNTVGPLMNKFTSAIAARGFDYDSVQVWSAYAPTEMELTQLQDAMHEWRIRPELKKTFYTPMKKFFRGVGVTFDKKGDVVIPLSESGLRYIATEEIGVGYGTATIQEERTTKEGKYEWRPNDEALTANLQFKKRGEKKASTEVAREKTIDRYNELNAPDPVTGLSQKQRNREAFLRDKEKIVDNEQAAVLSSANKAINALLRIVGNKKSTIQKLVKAEMAFIKKLKALGVWSDTKSPIIGRILVGTVKRYHKIGLRLLQKKISKQEARAIMGKITPFPIPKGLEQSTLSISQAESDLDLLHAMVDPERNQPELLQTAQALGIKLSRRDIAPSMSAMLRTMLETLPQDHVYRALAEKLLALNINDVGVQWDWDGKLLDDKTMGRFRIRQETGRQIYLNSKLLQRKRDLGGDMSASIVHTMLHEMVHAATHRAIRQNPGLRNTMLQMRQYTIDHWLGDLRIPYGLQEVTDKNGDQIADEFIAEAFSNPEFQEQLKQIYLNGRSLWRRLIDIVRNVLNLPNNTPVAVMDIIMSLESQLFEGSDLQIGAEEAIDLNMDSALRPAMRKIFDSLGQGVGSMKSIWDGISPPLIAMTQEQIRDTYTEYFGGKTGPLGRYMKAFFARSAENTRLMENAEKITRRWTAMDEAGDPANGVEMSRIATETTLAGVAMAPITDKRNEHVTSPKKKARHAVLYSRFRKLPQEYKTLYGDLQTYYRSTLENEVDLLTHNALRGLLQQDMTVKEFEAKYSVPQLRKFDTPEKFKAEFGQYLNDEMLATLNKMTHVRQQRQGDYFPIMRYGDFIVYAETEVESKMFTDSKKAHAYAAERRLDDMTWDVSTWDQDDGTFMVRVLDKDFRMAETKTKAEENRLDMIKEHGPNAKVSPVMLKSKKSQESAITSNAQLNQIITSLSGNPAAQAAIKKFYLETLSDASFRKHEMKRKNRKGAATDIQLRNFTVYAKQSSYYSSQLMYGSDMARGLVEMDKFIDDREGEDRISSVRLGQVYRELLKRDEMTVDINEIARFAKTSVEITQFMMLTSPSYWMINASQPWMVTLPWLNSKYGLAKSLSAMKNAQRLIAPDLLHASAETRGGLAALFSKAKAEKAFNVLDDVLEGIKKRDPENYVQYKEMLDELKQGGVIDLSWIAELRDISEGIDQGKWQKTLDASRVMAHLTEVNNRILTALATYELEKQKSFDNNLSPAEAHQAGIDMAKLSVSQTQFNYSSPNKPRLFQSGGPLGPAGPMVFQFMQWPQHMYALMIQNFSLMAGPDPVRRKEARKLLAGLFATHLAAGGILGAALQPVKWAFGMLAMVFGDEGEDTLKGAISGETFDRGTMKLLTDMFGSEIALVLSKGLPTIVGGDLSQRMSLGTVYYLNFRGDNAESAIGSLALGLGGASVNLVANFGRGLQHFYAGNYLRAIESASPKILRDVVRTGRYWDEGLVNRAGDTVIPSEGLSAWDLALQSMGVQPVVVSRFYAGQSAIKDKEIYFRDRKSDILRDFRAAVGNPSAVRRVMRNVADFNRNNPAIYISGDALESSFIGRFEREARYRRYGANITDEAATIFAEEADPYR